MLTQEYRTHTITVFRNAFGDGYTAYFDEYEIVAVPSPDEAFSRAKTSIDQKIAAQEQRTPQRRWTPRVIEGGGGWEPQILGDYNLHNG